MSCCGKKRRELQNTLKKPSNEKMPSSIIHQDKKETRIRVFVYKGPHNLTLRGINSGKIYRFKFPGDRIEVANEDSFSMMAEKDLEVAKK